MTRPPRVLAIAGSDSSGGAGIQADIKTITMLGGYAMTAITAITAQNTLGVQAVQALDADLVAQQMASCIEDIGVDAIKIGMLGSAEITAMVAAILVAAPDIAARSRIGRARRNIPPGVRPIPIVVDPVMVSTSNSVLAGRETVAAMQNRLFPIATLLTPNIPELEVLGECSVRDLDQMRDAALSIADRYDVPVFAKGGHSENASVIDLLVEPGGATLQFEHARVDTNHTHGTGCTVSSAIATALGAGMEMPDAIVAGRNFVHKALRAAPGFGSGHGPIGHHAVR